MATQLPLCNYSGTPTTLINGDTIAASNIGFTPPSGMVSTTVQTAIAEVFTDTQLEATQGFAVAMAIALG